VTDIGTNAFQGSDLTSVAIPNSIISIGDYAFFDCLSLTTVVLDNNLISIGAYAFSSPIPEPGSTGPLYQTCPLTSITIPDSVTTIGDYAFSYTAVASVTIPKSVISIGDGAFYGCQELTNVTMAEGLASIGASAFSGWIPGGTIAGEPPPAACPLTSIMIPNSVTSIGQSAFYDCCLTNAYFLGNAPSADTTVFSGDNVTAYYLPGTAGWAGFTTNMGVPTALWTLPNPLVLNGSSGVLNNQFGFTISWATNVPVVVEASADLSKPIWTPIATNTLTDGTSYFSDPQWTNYPARFNRLRAQ